jgi:hypothetical protein
MVVAVGGRTRSGNTSRSHKSDHFEKLAIAVATHQSSCRYSQCPFDVAKRWQNVVWLGALIAYFPHCAETHAIA